MADNPTLMLRAFVRVDGSSSGPTQLGAVAVPESMVTQVSPFGAIPVAKRDIAALLRSIADKLDPIAHTEQSQPIGMPSTRGGQDE